MLLVGLFMGIVVIAGVFAGLLLLVGMFFIFPPAPFIAVWIFWLMYRKSGFRSWLEEQLARSRRGEFAKADAPRRPSTRKPSHFQPSQLPPPPALPLIAEPVNWDDDWEEDSTVGDREYLKKYEHWGDEPEDSP